VSLRSGFGTESIPQVRKVVGPGSPAVTFAQVEMQRHGVATMMLLGPTESLVVADGTADPLRLAADLLVEAEHGTDTSVVLVTTSTEPRRRHRRRTRRSARRPPRGSSHRRPRGTRPNGGCVIVDDARRCGRRGQPLRTRAPPGGGGPRRVDAVVDGLVNAGEILIGQHTPFSAANFVIGCPASLPTSGFAHVSSGITADTFLKRTAVARADERAIARMARRSSPSPTTRASRPTPPRCVDAIRSTATTSEWSQRRTLGRVTDILLVEDDERISDPLVRVLTAEGFDGRPRRLRRRGARLGGPQSAPISCCSTSPCPTSTVSTCAVGSGPRGRGTDRHADSAGGGGRRDRRARRRRRRLRRQAVPARRAGGPHPRPAARGRARVARRPRSPVPGSASTPEARRAYRGSDELELTTKEFDLLALLMSRPA
jgi:hypothetical protein